MEITNKSWSQIALNIVWRVALRSLLGGFAGLLAGIFSGALCGAIFAVWMTRQSTELLTGLLFGACCGIVVGFVSGALAFAIQGLILALHNPAQWDGKWRLSLRFLWTITVFSSVTGGFSLAALYLLWDVLFNKNTLLAAFYQGDTAFFFGSIASYSIGTLMAALAPERLEEARLAWRKWRWRKTNYDLA